MSIRFLNETRVFEWKQVSWMKIRYLNEINETIEHLIMLTLLENKMIKRKQKSKILNELTIIESELNYWLNMPLLFIYSAIGHKTEFFE